MGAERKSSKNAVFLGKRHDNKILKVQILLSRNYVVIAQAPTKVHFGIFFLKKMGFLGILIDFFGAIFVPLFSHFLDSILQPTTTGGLRWLKVD